MLILLLLVVPLNGLTNYIRDGNFSAFLTTAPNPFLGSWYNTSSANGEFDIISDAGNNVLQLTSSRVCQNVSLPLHTIAYLAFQLKAEGGSPQAKVELNGVVLFDAVINLTVYTLF